MLCRVVFSLIIIAVATRAIYDPGDGAPTNNIRLHHNYSRVRVQRPITQQQQQIRVKRNKTRIEIYTKCPKGGSGQFVFELSCNQFLNCWKGRGFVQNCAPGTLFNPKTLECDYAEKVQCVTGPRQSMLLHHQERLTEETQPGCPDGFSGIIPHYTDCAKFINCDRGRENVMDCAPGTVFDVNTNNCDYPSKAQCVNQDSFGRRVGHEQQEGLGHRVSRYRTLDQTASRYQNIESASSHGSNADRQRQTSNIGQNPEFYDQNIESSSATGTRNQNRPNQNFASSSSVRGHQNFNSYDQNIGSSSSTGTIHRNQELGGSSSVRKQSNYDQSYDQNLDFYDQGVESSSSIGTRQQNRPKQNFEAVRGQPNYDVNHDQNYDRNVESSSLTGSNHQSRRNQHFGAGSTIRRQPNYDQNTEFYDQTVEPSSSSSTKQNRSNQNFGTNYEQNTNLGFYDQNVGTGSSRPNYNFGGRQPNYNQDDNSHEFYDQNVGSTSSTGVRQQDRTNQHFGASSAFQEQPYYDNLESFNHRYRPVQNVAINYQSSSNSDHQNGTYARAHQVNSFRPTQNVDEQELSAAGRYRPYQNLNTNTYVGQETNYQATNTAPKCPEGGSGLYEHPYDCSKFLNCANGMTYVQDCGPGTLFNPLLKVCDFPYNVRCAANLNQQVGYGQEAGRNGAGLQWQSSTGRPFYSSRPSTSLSDIDRYEQSVYEQQNKNYGHRPVGSNAGGSFASQTGRTNTSSRPQTQGVIVRRPLYDRNNTNRYDQVAYETQSKNYDHKPNGFTEGAGFASPTSRTNTSPRPQIQKIDDQGTFYNGNSLGRYDQTVYEQQSRNYEGKPAGSTQGDGFASPTSRTNTSPRPQIQKIDDQGTFYNGNSLGRYDQTVYDQQNRNYEQKPAVPTEGDGPTTRSYISPRPQTQGGIIQRPLYNLNKTSRYDQTVPEHQNKNYEHQPVEPTDETNQMSRTNPSYRPQTQGSLTQRPLYGDFDQQNKIYEHRHVGQWVPIEGDASARPDTYQRPQNGGVIVQKPLSDNSNGYEQPEPFSASSTNRPINGFYLTKPPETVHTAKPRNLKPYETPEVDYVYEYDDDIIVDAQPAATNKKPQSPTCRPGEHFCSNNQCISNLVVCDGLQDCSDGKDETNCDIAKFTLTKNNKLAVAEKRKIANTTVVGCAKFCQDEYSFHCRAFNYRKHDGVCYLLDRNIGLSGSLIIYQIFDYYELTSQSINCTNLFVCPNKKCVAYSKLCDGENDCGDRTDEKHCSAHALGYSVRLVGSASTNEGSIEITALGKTGYVCDDQFGLRDADVVCRELGFDLGALEVRANSYFAKELGNKTLYLMDDVGCMGNESSLRDCDFSGWGVHNCMAQEVVGVVCKTPNEKCKEGYWQCDNEQECIPLPFLCDDVYDCTDSSDEADTHCNAPIELRLANGSTHLEGRVEIKHLGTWGTICDDDFNEDAAKVVCKYFGFEGSASVRKNGYFGPGKGPVWLDQVFCQGNESAVEECVHWDWGEHNCDHSEDVGVICSERAFADGTERHSQNQVLEPPKVEPLQLLPERCGLRKDNIFSRDDEVHFRVIKGSEAKKGDYPWQASVRVKGKSKPTHWCGAVVISQRFVLTAAHCLVGFAKGAYIIVAGDYHVDEDEGTEQVALIEDFYLHEDFRKVQKMNNDIALVKLKGNGFTITEDVQPICLPDLDTPYTADLNCTISGFGSTKSGKAFYSHQLRAGWIPLQSREVCKMPHIYGSSITEGMICAGFLDAGVDACDGDSGGPLACLHEGVFTLFGLTSWGQHCGYANKPGVYVKVAHYRNWIEEKMHKYA